MSAEREIGGYGAGISGINIEGNGAYNASIGTLTNAEGGTISGTNAETHRAYGIQLYGFYSNASITTLTNSGTISGTAKTSEGKGIYLISSYAEASITTLTNAEGGTISGTAETTEGIGIYLFGYYTDTSITTLTNSGTISGTAATSEGYGIYLNAYYEDASITTLTNSGTISGTAATSEGYGIYLYNQQYMVIMLKLTITTLTNTGTISGSTHDIKNSLNIVNLNNSQGKEGNDVLTYNGKLPTNYNVIVNSTSDYGQASFTGESGTTNFGVSSSSTFSGAATYASVISGLATDNIGATRSGTVGGYSWELVLQSGEIWDLVITSSRTGYTSRISTGKRSNIAAILEAINTAGSNSALTSALDGLSDASLR